MAVAEELLAGAPFKASHNDYDWLGPGIYFWEANPKRGLMFAEESATRSQVVISAPAVVGAVTGALHEIRPESGFPQVDTIKGVFVERQPIYATVGFHEHTHIQICVRSPECIKGVFRVPDRFLT